MTNEVVLLMGVPGFAVSADVAIGTVITLGSDGLWKLTAAGDEIFFVAQAVTTSASGTLVAGRYETEMFTLVEGHDGTDPAAIAVGADLMVAAGKLRKWASGAKVGKAMTAVDSGATTLIRVLYQK